MRVPFPDLIFSGPERGSSGEIVATVAKHSRVLTDRPLGAKAND
jgi:hypothetical protein